MVAECLTEYQTLFSLFTLSDQVKIENSTIKSLTSVGPYKTVFGRQVLKPDHIYSFSFKIINALTCKIGIIEKTVADEYVQRNKDEINSFSDFNTGYSVFSNGYPRHGTHKNNHKSNPFFRALAPGDVVSVIFDGIEGRLEFYLNKEFGGYFIDAAFKTTEYYPAVDIQGEMTMIEQILL